MKDSTKRLLFNPATLFFFVMAIFIFFAAREGIRMHEAGELIPHPVPPDGVQYDPL